MSGLICGVASAGFLAGLDLVTGWRLAHPWLVWWLPLVGVLMGLAAERIGVPVKAGTSLLIERARDGGPRVPLRMAPIVLIGTWVTHLFGGSAGREGTAVQMGASLTDWVTHRVPVDAEVRRRLLLAGVAGGFGSVFGTPIAGVVFALEFVAPGTFAVAAFVPAVIAAFLGDFITRALGIVHTPYPTLAPLEWSLPLAGKWALFAFGIWAATVAFIALKKRVSLSPWGEGRGEGSGPVRMFGAGVVVVAVWWLFDAGDALGLGVPTIVRAFHDAGLPVSLFAVKLVLTAVTVGAGFFGGEVTPLFFIGAALGNVLARGLGLPIDYGAGVGMAVCFGLASNAPLALAVMAGELLGVNVLSHVLVVMVIASVLHRRKWSIYPAQLKPAERG